MGERSVTELAAHIGVVRATISCILDGCDAVSIDLSIRLGQALSRDFFAKVQLRYELWRESQKRRRSIKPLITAMAS